MYKLLVLCCVVVGGVLAEPVPFQNKLSERRLVSCRGQQQAGQGACAGARGQLVAHPADCRLFFYCTRVGPVCHRCPLGLHFNPALHVCDWPKKAGCTASSSTEPPSTPSDPPTTPADSAEVETSSESPSSSEPPSSEPPAVSELPSSSADPPASEGPSEAD